MYFLKISMYNFRRVFWWAGLKNMAGYKRKKKNTKERI